MKNDGFVAGKCSIVHMQHELRSSMRGCLHVSRAGTKKLIRQSPGGEYLRPLAGQRCEGNMRRLLCCTGLAALECSPLLSSQPYPSGSQA